ncbi:MAG: saccharopine dehydrogenase C-terminal domain-containing protein [Acidobacteriia bacterium]|nr:saccharopine dehydrogenase C-terminal domain-containing protein [Terriglobia bacterium]
MKILVLGAGWMGRAAAYDLARSRGVQHVGLADQNAQALRDAQHFAGRPHVSAHRLDVARFSEVTSLMRRYDATIGAVSYKFNYPLAQCAVRAGCHFCDLGGNDTVVNREFTLNAAARKRQVRIVPDCGLAPGMVSLVVADGLSHFKKVDSVLIRVGGLPLKPEPPLNYQLVFSVGGLINEYVEPARVLRGGKIAFIESMTGLEELEFPAPFGTLEAFFTSGGASTLPLTLKGKVRELNYKTIRYPGHCEKFKTMIDLGLTSGEPISFQNASTWQQRVLKIAPREVLEKLLVEKLPSGHPDCVLIRVTLRGILNGKNKELGSFRNRSRASEKLSELSYQLIDYYDPKTHLTAMMRTTAVPISIVAQMLTRGDVIGNRFGVLRQETSLQPRIFMNELKSRGICFETNF